MKRRQFALSWGRKLFFGLGWPVIAFLGLNYFQARIFPTSLLETVYFISTFIGHYGLFVSLIYFLLYVPVVMIFPTYYISRFWGIVVITIGSLFVLIDSLIFVQYGFHFNSLIFKFIIEGSAGDVFFLKKSTYLVASAVVLVFLTLIWIRGEILWRSMQKRFGNYNKNWYLILILISLLTSHLIHIYGDAFDKHKIAKLSQIFPIHFPATAKGFLKKMDYVSKESVPDKNSMGIDLKYPKKAMSCSGVHNKNILFIVIDSWRFDELNTELTPFLSHYAEHGVLFKDHHSASNNMRGGIYSLFYSLPEAYWKETLNNQRPPVFIEELIKNSYKFGVFSSKSLTDLEFDKTVFNKVHPLRSFSEIDRGERERKVTDEWKNWISDYSIGQMQKPFFGFLLYGNHSVSESEQGETFRKQGVQYVDGLIYEVIESLHQKKVLNNTIVVVTGNHGNGNNFSKNEINVPLLILWPERKNAIIESYTSHYDIIPTIMRDEWDCKNDFKEYSYGGSLFSARERDWHLAGGAENYGIIDYKKNMIITVAPDHSYSVTDLNLKTLPIEKARKDLILSVFRDLIYFRK